MTTSNAKVVTQSLATGYLIFYFAVLGVAATINLRLPPSTLFFASIVVLGISIGALYCIATRKGLVFLGVFIALWSLLAIGQTLLGFTIALADLAISILAGASLYVTRHRYRPFKSTLRQEHLSRESRGSSGSPGSSPGSSDDAQRPAA